MSLFWHTNTSLHCLFQIPWTVNYVPVLAHKYFLTLFISNSLDSKLCPCFGTQILPYIVYFKFLGSKGDCWYIFSCVVLPFQSTDRLFASIRNAHYCRHGEYMTVLICYCNKTCFCRCASKLLSKKVVRGFTNNADDRIGIDGWCYIKIIAVYHDRHALNKGYLFVLLCFMRLQTIKYRPCNLTYVNNVFREV